MKNSLVAAVLLLVQSISGAASPTLEGAEVNSGMTKREEADATLESLLRVRAPAPTALNGIRTTMLRDAGRKLGFRAGLKARGTEIQRQLEARASSLDKIFQFSTLVTPDGVLPPVVDQAIDVATFAVGQVRTADLVLRIVREERFVALPPSWRDYLVTGLMFKNIDLPDPEAQPKNDAEADTWRRAVRIGWEEGTSQADAILAANFNRLTRDYTGMLTYSTLLQQGMIRRTQVGEGFRAVAGDTVELHIGERLRRIVDRAALEVDEARWRAAITPASNRPRATTAAGPGELDR